MIAKKYKIKTKDFLAIFKKAKTFEDKLFRYKYLIQEGGTKKFAVVIKSSLAKNATERNKLKRLIYDFLKNQLTKFKPGLKLIIFLKIKSTDLGLPELKSHLAESLNKFYQ